MGPTFDTIRRSWAKHFVSQVSAIIILTATYTAALFILQSASSIESLFYSWGKINKATLYVSDQSDKHEIDSILKEVGKSSLISSAKFVSQDEAAQSFGKRFAKLLPKSAGSEKMSSFFPKTIHLQLKNPIRTEGENEQFSLFASSIKKKFPSVEDVTFGQSWMKKYIHLIAAYGRFSYFLAMVILLASLFITSNVLKTVLFSHRDEIEILQLIGATSFWIYAPHIFNCLILSLTAYVTAMFANHGIYQIIGEYFSSIFPMGRASGAVTPAGTMAFVAILLSLSVVTSALLTISKMLPQRIVYNNKRERRLNASLGRKA